MDFSGRKRGIAVGRTFAGILGHVALTLIVARGMRYGAGFNSTLCSALLGLAAFALLGFCAGTLAEWIVEQSVRARVAAEVESQSAKTAA